MSEQFYEKMIDAMKLALFNTYDDNFDALLVQPNSLDKFRMRITKVLQYTLRLIGKSGAASVLILPQQNYFLDNLEKFNPLFDSLADKESQNRMVELIVFRIFGPTRVKLSLNNDAYWRGRKQVNQSKLSEVIEVKNFRCNLSLFDLKSYGYDLKVFFASNGIYVDFVLQQYNYNNLVKVKKNDIVIDAGACWGDTALYFSVLGARAVYAYEFIPSNLEVFRKNVALNKQFQDCIHIVESPVWNQSDIALSYDDKGPASQVAEIGKYKGNAQTLSIDDLVLRQNLESVDFIKMDIEGAEMPALIGAAETIKRFKPKLAISVYHQPDDMITIPEYIQSLNSGYEFYLDYYTIVGHEIVLYAIDRNAK